MNDIHTQRFERKIEQCKRIIARTEPIISSPMETPSTFVTGASKYPRSLARAHERENNHKAEAFRRWQKATSDLKFWENRLALYRAGEIHENGQPRADAPSRQRKQSAADRYAEYLRSIAVVGGEFALMMNPRNTITVKRINAKSITDELGEKWKYDELLPLSPSGEAMTGIELKAALRDFFAGLTA